MTPPVLRSLPRIDLRFALGVVLILVSVIGVWLVVSAARTTVPVLVAKRTLLPGEMIVAEDTRLVDVLLSEAGSHYLKKTPHPAMVLRTIEEGELVPRGAITDSYREDETRVVVKIAGEISTEIKVGSAVDVWVTENIERGVGGEPRLLVEGARVARIASESGMMARSGASIELSVKRALLPRVLAALAADAAISLVPGFDARDDAMPVTRADPGGEAQGADGAADGGKQK